MRLDSKRSARSAIGLTPLIDVVFILLLFFMLASNLERFNRIEVASSDAGAQAGEQRSSLFLRVHGDGSFSLVDVRMNALTLERRIKAHLDRNAANAVVVHPDGDVRLQHLIDVLDRLAELGVAELTLG